MRRTSPLVVPMALAALVLAPSAAGAKAFDSGVAAGEVTPSSAKLWTRVGKAGKVTLEVSTDRRLRRVAITRTLSAKAAADTTVQAVVKGLRPATAYAYRFRRGKTRSAIGRFTTAPATDADASISFAFTGDADAQRASGASKPYYNAFQVYGRMAREGNDFNINFGDTIYSDTEVPGAGGPATTVPQKWAKYRQNLALPNLQKLRSAGATYSHWDDHEFINDYDQGPDTAIYKAGVKAFTDYAPVTYTREDGLYRTFRWGKNLELFFLDERSFRSRKADQACINPTNSQPDLGPTAPTTTRSIFGVLVPALRTPVAQSCLDAINDPARTFLGQRQLAAFEQAVKASTATFKVVMNETPLQQFYALPYDRWEGYAAERTKVIEFLRDNVKNVVVLTTDTHANFVNEVRLRTLEVGGPVGSGILEAVTGPAATMTFNREIDAATGRVGNGVLLTNLFFRAALPPEGAGLAMQCAVTDTYSYDQVTVTSKTLTITPKDLTGKPLQQVAGALKTPCGPFKVNRK